MKIAIESTPLLVKNKTGVEHYTHRLMQAVLELDHKNNYELVYIAFATKPKPNLELKSRNTSIHRISWLPGKAYNLTLRMPVGLAIDLISGVRPDIFFFPNFIRWPLMFTKKSVVVVHDTAYLDYPSVLKTTHHRLYLQWAVPRSIKKATHVVAVSEYTKQQLIRHYGTNPDKITVISPAVDHNIFKPATMKEISAVKNKLGINRDYILFMGTIDPRKNVTHVVKAYLALPEDLRDRYQLVLAGGRGWKREELDEIISSADEDEIVQTGYVELSDQPGLYSGATALVYPSAYEGWGMQIQESMACGTPAIVANNTSLPEAAGTAALYVTTGDQNMLNNQLLRLLSDEELLNKLRSESLSWAAKSSWEISAQRLINLWDEI